MAEVNSLEILIQANADSFRRELADVNGRLSQLGGTANTVSSKMGGSLVGSVMKANIASQILIGTAKTLGNAIFKMGSNVVNLGTQYTRLKVATDTVTRNMGMTRQEVDDLRYSLEDANTYGSRAEEVIKTLAMSGLVDMARELKAVDARTGEVNEGVNALVLTLKDLGAAAGVDSSEAIQRVTKFVRTGNQAFADGIIELGNMRYAYERYAATLGKTGIQLTEQERATARLNLVMQEGEKAFGAYANTMQTAGKAMGSIRDATISMFERLGNYLEPIFASVARAVFLFVDGMRQSLIGSAETFRAWANKVAAYVIAVVRILGSLLSRIPIIGKNFNALRDFALKPVSTAMDTLAGATGGAGGKMDDATSSAKALRKELMGLAAFDEMNVLKAPEGDSGGGMGGVGGMGVGGMDLSDLIKAEDLNQNIDKINAMANEIEGRIRNMIKKVQDFFKPISDFWNKWAKPAFDALSLSLKEVFELFGINTEEVNIWAKIVQIGAKIVILALTGVVYIVNGLVWLWLEFGKEVGKVMEVCKLAVKGWAAVIRGDTESATRYGLQIFSMFSPKVQEAFIAIANRVGQVRESIKSSFSNIASFVGSVISGIVGMFDQIGVKWNQVAHNLGQAMIGALGSVTSWLKSFINTQIIRRLNDARVLINKIPGVSIPYIYPLAKGGVVESPTLALMGESGKEAVLPLENNTEWMNDLADKIGGGQPMSLVIKLGEDKIYEKFIDFVNDTSLRSNTKLLNI